MRPSALSLILGPLLALAQLPPASPQTRAAPRNRFPILLGETLPDQFCTTDASCPGNEHCWKTNNGQECQLPLQEHRGYCPKDTTNPDQATICLAQCSTDYNCSSGVGQPNEKCCSFGCMRKCAVAEEVRSDGCQLPCKTGPCRAQIPRYFYCPSQKKCLQFIYGGCQGNSNNFETKKACEQSCGKLGLVT